MSDKDTASPPLPTGQVDDLASFAGQLARHKSQTVVQQAAALPASELGTLTARAELTLAQAVSIAGGDDTQFLILGDSAHGSSNLTAQMLSPEVVIAAAEQNFEVLCLEWPKKYQPLVDALIAGTIEPRAYAEKLLDDDGTITGMTHEQSISHLLKIEVPAILLAARVGMEVHFVDTDLTVKTGAEAREALAASLDPAWIQKNRREYISLTSMVERNQDEFFYTQRFDDRELAGRINAIAGDRKTLIIYGGQHGSQYNDFEEHLSGPAIRVAVYNQPKQLERYRAVVAEDLDNKYIYQNDDDPERARYYEDKPELLVMLSGDPAKGGAATLYQTTNTPDWLKTALAPLGFTADIEGQKIIDHALKRAARTPQHHDP